MDKEKFLAGMKSDIHFEPQERNDILNKSLKSCEWKTKVTIAIEELAELQQALSKHIRGCGDRNNLLEEMADAAIVYYYIEAIFGITKEELDKAVDVKVERERMRL